MLADSLPFLGFQGPYVHTLNCPQGECDDFVIMLRFLSLQVWVAVARGERMGTRMNVLMETASSLQFPLYFGRNGNALWDCALDLCWMEWSKLVFIVAEADRAFGEMSAAERIDYLQLMADAAQSWSQASEIRHPFTDEPRPFHVVIHSEKPDTLSTLSAELEERGCSVGIIKSDHLAELRKRYETDTRSSRAEMKPAVPRPFIPR